MKIYIPNPFTGVHRTYEVTPETTVKELAKMITEKEAIPFPGTAIHYLGNNISRYPKKTIKNLKIVNNSKLFLTSKGENFFENNSEWDGGKRKTRANRKNRRNMTRRRR